MQPYFNTCLFFHLKIHPRYLQHPDSHTYYAPTTKLANRHSIILYASQYPSTRSLSESILPTLLSTALTTILSKASSLWHRHYCQTRLLPPSLRLEYLHSFIHSLIIYLYTLHRPLSKLLCWELSLGTYMSMGQEPKHSKPYLSQYHYSHWISLKHYEDHFLLK